MIFNLSEIMTTVLLLLMEYFLLWFCYFTRVNDRFLPLVHMSHLFISD